MSAILASQRIPYPVFRIPNRAIVAKEKKKQKDTKSQFLSTQAQPNNVFQ